MLLDPAKTGLCAVRVQTPVFHTSANTLPSVLIQEGNEEKQYLARTPEWLLNFSSKWFYRRNENFDMQKGTQGKDQ